MKYFGIFVFIFIEILGVMLYSLLTHNRHFKNRILIISLVNIIVTIDVAVNYVAALSGYYDGISIQGYLSKFLISSDEWSIHLFRNHYYIMSIYSLFTLLIYLLTSLKEKAQGTS